MIITQLKRWHWLAIAILVGLGLWLGRRGQVSDISHFGEGLTSQATFEQALLTEIQGIRAFKNVEVYRTLADDGAGHATPIDIVAGKYCNGTAASDGKFHWSPFVFVARVPYQPGVDLSTEFWRAGLPDAQSRWQAIRQPSVLDFLRLAHDYRNVQFTHAWWNEHVFLTWFGGSLLLIGIVWPCVTDLIVYGRLIRPAEEKGIDLSKVKQPAPRPAAAPVRDWDRLHELEDELEQNLAGAGPPSAPDAPVAQPVRALNPEPQTATITDDHEHKNYRRKADDYYPTEERNHKPAGSARTP